MIEHEQSFDPDNIRDLTDEYLLEWKAAEKRGEEHLFRRGGETVLLLLHLDRGDECGEIWLDSMRFKTA